MSRLFSSLFGLTIIGFVLTFMKMRKMSASGWKSPKQKQENQNESAKEVMQTA